MMGEPRWKTNRPRPRFVNKLQLLPKNVIKKYSFTTYVDFQREAAVVVCPAKLSIK